MTRAPRVSIGMPVHNGANYLAEALDSLLTQSYKDFELIVSDNHSSDDTRQICQRFAACDRRVRIIRSRVNRGAAWNHNTVMGEARGELFKLAAHDDVCAPELLEACVDTLDTHPDAVLAWPRTMMMMRGDMSHLQLWRSDMELGSPVAAMRFGDLIHEAPPSFPLFGVARMSALRRIPGYDSFKASDRVVLARLALLGPLVQASGADFYYRWHDSNATHLVGTPRAFYGWWDPTKGGSRVYPETRLLFEWVRSLWVVPIAASDRRQCAREIRLWYQERRPRIGNELAQLVGRSLDCEPPASLAEQLARHSRRRRMKQSLYGSADPQWSTSGDP